MAVMNRKKAVINRRMAVIRRIMGPILNPKHDFRFKCSRQIANIAKHGNSKTEKTIVREIDGTKTDFLVGDRQMAVKN